MSLASIFSILAMLLILGMFFVITVNINLFTEVVKQDYDQIEVFLLDDTDKAQAEQIMTQIRTHEGVTDVQYRSKAEALEILKERWGESGYLLDSLGKNPLPASILISVESLDNAGEVAAYAGTLDGIEDVQYYQETVEKLTKITNFLQIGALIIMAFLVVVSVVVVSNTVKLTVFARAKEIRIMKDVLRHHCRRNYYRNACGTDFDRAYRADLQRADCGNRGAGSGNRFDAADFHTVYDREYADHIPCTGDEHRGMRKHCIDA